MPNSRRLIAVVTGNPAEVAATWRRLAAEDGRPS